MPRRRRTQVKSEEIKSHVYDPFRDFEGTTFELYVSKFFFFVRQHRRNVIIFVSVLVLAITGSTGYLIFSDIQETESLHAFEQLMTEPTMRVGSGAEAAAIRKLDEYEDTYSNRRARQRSRIHKIELYIASKKLKEAGDTAILAAEDAETPELKAYFTFKAAALYESAGLNEQCSTAYERCIGYLSEANILKAEAMFGQGRCLYGLGKGSEARQVLKQMMELGDVPGIEEVRTTAASFLISRRPR